MVRSYLFLLITMIIFSGNILVGKALNDLPAVTLTFIRCFIAFMILLPISLTTVKTNCSLWLKEWKPLVGLTISGIVLFNILLYSSLQFTSSTNVAIIEATTPVFAGILGFFFLKERLTSIQLAGILLSLLGALWVITGSWDFLGAFVLNRGDLLVVIAVISWAVYSILVMKHNHKFPIYGQLTIMLGIALILLFPFFLAEWNQHIVSLLTPKIIIGLLYLGIFPSVIALLFWNKGVAEIGPARASIFLNLLPVFTIIGAVLFFNESISFIQLVGSGVVIFGVILTNQKPRKVEKEENNVHIQLEG